MPVERHVADQTTTIDQEARHPVGDALLGSGSRGRDRLSELLELGAARRLEAREVGVDALRFFTAPSLSGRLFIRAIEAEKENLHDELVRLIQRTR